MTTIDTACHATLTSRILSDHGFRHDSEKGCWSKSNWERDAIAVLDEDYPMLNLMLCQSNEDQLIFETRIDLTTFDEATLERVLSAFDLS